MTARIGDSANWVGGFFELAIELGPRDDERLDQAVRHLARVSGAAGWYRSVGGEPDRQRRDCTLATLSVAGTLRGTVTLPNGAHVVCGILTVREDEGDSGGYYRPDWLCFFLPMGALARLDSRVGGYPFGDFAGSLAWPQPIDDWMAGIARQVHALVPFRLGLIGMEVSGETYSEDLDASAPVERHCGYLVPEIGSLTYLPANA